MSRLARGVEKWNGWPHNCVCWFRNRRDFLAVVVPPKKQRTTAPHGAPKPGILVLGRGAPTKSG